MAVAAGSSQWEWPSGGRESEDLPLTAETGEPASGAEDYQEDVLHTLCCHLICEQTHGHVLTQNVLGVHFYTSLYPFPFPPFLEVPGKKD